MGRERPLIMGSLALITAAGGIYFARDREATALTDPEDFANAMRKKAAELFEEHGIPADIDDFASGYSCSTMGPGRFPYKDEFAIQFPVSKDIDEKLTEETEVTCPEGAERVFHVFPEELGKDSE